MNFNPPENIDINYGALGIRLRILRGKEKQVEFGRRFGLTQADISRYENGTSKPPVDFLFKVSMEFKKPIEWLLVGVGKHLKKDAETGDYLEENMEDYNEIVREIEEKATKEEQRELDEILGRIAGMHKRARARLKDMSKKASG